MRLVSAFTTFAALLPFLTVPCCSAGDEGSSSTFKRRRKPLENYQKLFRPMAGTRTNNRFSILNMTCDFYQQPLNHFDLPRGRSSTYLQRYCMYDDFVKNASEAPVFFYTGNESPLEEYINNTGLIWELAQDFGAQIAFVEHRYEGRSLPSPNISHCMAYSSSVQALADFADFIERKLFQSENNNRTSGSLDRRPVIAFGGSYGGMLSAWMRMKYPNIIAGAIAGSAPIWGFARNFPCKIDTAFQVIQRGLEYSYPPTTKPKRDDNHCTANLLAAWPLIQVLGKNFRGRQLLTKSFRLCEALLKDADVLIEWAQSPWFDLAEGSFPYPSSYITYALTHREVKLPAWPLQAACWNVSKLHRDYGIRFEGNRSDVRYNITYGDSGVQIGVDWDKAVSILPNLDNLESATITGLLESVRDAVSIWFNVTKDVKCYNLTAAPSTGPSTSTHGRARSMEIHPLRGVVDKERRLNSDNSTAMCWDKISNTGSWPALCCNEEMNLIITEASGLGRDAMWPPSHPRGTLSHADVIALMPNATDPFCADPDGYYGFPQDPPDPWSTWMDIVYGGTFIESHTNIVFSNGLLDPWSAAGVYAKDPTQSSLKSNNTGIPGLFVQNIGGSDSMIALIMEYGGHHTDLMYSDPADPPCITEARKIEKKYIARWIQEFWEAT